MFFFKSSNILQAVEVTNFFKEQLGNPYNKYCIDCKKNLTTHAVVLLGAYVCKDCAELHRSNFGNSTSYVKDIYNEHWDDY